eukprot:SAG22_NODE_9624_length_579_cov_0.714583_1_plen_94_part_10
MRFHNNRPLRLDQAMLTVSGGGQGGGGGWPFEDMQHDAEGGSVSPQLRASAVAAAKAEAAKGEERQALLMDVLWSDPTESDAVHGVHANRMRGG